MTKIPLLINSLYKFCLVLLLTHLHLHYLMKTMKMLKIRVRDWGNLESARNHRRLPTSPHPHFSFSSPSHLCTPLPSLLLRRLSTSPQP
ncbi:hypothetical protein Hanom_Chr07g00589471 [Helianthus anomalus]